MHPHDTDFYGWTREQAALLREGRFSEVDLKNVIEEIEDMGSSTRRQLETRLEVLLMHLLKWQFQPSHQGKSWILTLIEQRRRIDKLIRKNPSLNPLLPEALADAYDDARHSAMLETGLPLETFPVECPWTLEQTLDPEFLPGSPPSS